MTKMCAWKWSVDFENTKYGDRCSYCDIVGADANDAINNAQRHFKEPNEWVCIGVDRTEQYVC